MTTMDDRLKSIEGQYAFHEKQSFETEARTSKCFGLWVAELLGLDGADAETYARTVVETNLEEPGFNDVLRKVCADLDQKGVEYDHDYLFKKLDDCVEIAKRELP